MFPQRARAGRFLVSALVSALALLPVPLAHATPPRSPIDLRVTLLETPRPGRDVPFAIEATPLLPGAELKVTIAPPRDVALVRGRPNESRRDVAPGRTQRFDGAVRVPPGRRHYVYVRAELVTREGRRYVQGQHLVVLAGPLATPDPQGRIVPDGRGGTLVEYDAARPGASR